MNDAGLLLVVGVAAVGIIVIIALLMRTKGPAHTASTDDEAPETTSGQFYRGVDRPAGPDAEASPSTEAPLDEGPNRAP